MEILSFFLYLLEENGVFYLHPVILRGRDAYPVGLQLFRGAAVHLRHRNIGSSRGSVQVTAFRTWQQSVSVSVTQRLITLFGKQNKHLQYSRLRLIEPRAKTTRIKQYTYDNNTVQGTDFSPEHRQQYGTESSTVRDSNTATRVWALTV